MAWNSLPDFIRYPTSSTDCFRRLLYTYLFARYLCIQRIRDINDYALYKFTHSIENLRGSFLGLTGQPGAVMRCLAD